MRAAKRNSRVKIRLPGQRPESKLPNCVRAGIASAEKNAGKVRSLDNLTHHHAKEFAKTCARCRPTDRPHRAVEHGIPSLPYGLNGLSDDVLLTARVSNDLIRMKR